jgi:plasmid stabilization system protein ParE
LAVQQLASIALYIGRTSPLYAERMVERILRRVDTLAEFPEIGLRASEAEDENVREVVENPYRILYLAQTSRVDILAIVHGRQEITWPR